MWCVVVVCVCASGLVWHVLCGGVCVHLDECGMYLCVVCVCVYTWVVVCALGWLWHVLVCAHLGGCVCIWASVACTFVWCVCASR